MWCFNRGRVFMLSKFFSRYKQVAPLVFLLFLFSLCFFISPVVGNTVDASFSVTSPHNGETLIVGQKYTITWTYTGEAGQYIQIQLYKGGQYKSTISTYVSVGSNGSGAYSWKLPASLAEGDDYQIKISSKTKSTVFAFSGTFAIKKSVQSEKSLSSTVSQLQSDILKLTNSIKEELESRPVEKDIQAVVPSTVQNLS